MYFSIYSFTYFKTYSHTTLVTIESPAVEELKKQNNDDGSVTLIWKKPAGFNGINAQYVVAYNGERYTLNMSQTEYTITSKQKDESFIVEVRTYLMFLSIYQEVTFASVKSIKTAVKRK